MAESKSAKSAPKKAGNSNSEFTMISKTTTTVYQNGKGVKRKVTETTTAPKMQKQQSAPKPPAKKPTTSKGVSKK